MKDEPTNKSDTLGKKDDKPVETADEPLSDLEKLKAHNAEFEKELVKGREQKKEMQQIESEKLLGGTSGGHVEDKAEDPAQKAADEIVNAFN